MKTKKPFVKRWREDRWYLFFTLPMLLLMFFFVYRPMYGLLIAFQNYKIGKPILTFDGSVEWVGLDYFVKFVKSIFFKRVMGNTLRLNLLFLFFNSWVPVAAALLLNEIRVSKVKRTVQTMYYLPYFISSVVVVSIITLLLSSSGPFARISMLLGGQAENYLNNPKYFDAVYVVSGVWQSFGYGSIIYMAALSGVDPSLYEAVTVDGGNRWHKLRYVSLPYILPTFAVLLILNVGGTLRGDPQKILLMYNSFTMDRADIIDTYVYRVGLVGAEYSYTAAVGLFVNILNFLLVFGANAISRKLTDSSLW